MARGKKRKKRERKKEKKERIKTKLETKQVSRRVKKKKRGKCSTYRFNFPIPISQISFSKLILPEQVTQRLPTTSTAVPAQFYLFLFFYPTTRHSCRNSSHLNSRSLAASYERRAILRVRKRNVVGGTEKKMLCL